ncbi:DUF1580 domain-containing protein [Planctomicrobium sp. SH664]|uniref:DUF1580 domain-containing protein n=1 Tax=Planctomicrobium sp. SH664 TaxID=3448125 RepID=UPI003F5BFAD3
MVIAHDTLPEILSGQLEPIRVTAKRRTGKHPSPPTEWRWVRIGVAGGNKLPAALVGGRWCTTPAAFDAWIAAQTAAALARQSASKDASNSDLRAADLL